MSLLNKFIFGSLGTIIGGNVVVSIIENDWRNCDTVVEAPVNTVGIIIPTFNEEMFIERMMLSIKNQSIVEKYPDSFEYILIDSGSTDNTVDLARLFMKTNVDKIVHLVENSYSYENLAKKVKSDRIVITNKKGKLTARNMATDIAKSNIIVSVDADCIYPYHFLNTLLKPFKDETTVAVDGSTIDYTIPKIPGQLYTLMFWFEHNYRNVYRLHGRHCAYLKSAFNQIGKFDESINQLNVYEMVREEEVRFGNKMKTIGKVVWKQNAYCEHLGGLKMSCRGKGLNKGSLECKNSGVGIERFG